MTDPAEGPERTPEPEASPAAAAHTPRASQGETPLYKGEPLEAERGPGLGCFWMQVIFLGVLLVLTPLTVIWAWPAEVSAVLLIVTLLLLLFAGQTVIFLLRLVAADRRSRRVPRSASARRTVGMLEDEASGAADAASPPQTETPGAPQGLVGPETLAGPASAGPAPPGPASAKAAEPAWAEAPPEAADPPSAADPPEAADPPSAPR